MNIRRNQKVERVRREKARLESRPETPLKRYRSEAERIAIKQRNIQIGLSLIILVVATTSLLVNLKVI